MVNFVNLTLHAIVLRTPSGEDITIPPSGIVARVASTPGREWNEVESPVPIFTAPSWGAVQNLPAPVSGTIYIVSGMVAAHMTREDVVSPGTGPDDGAIRNEKGHIVAVTRLILS